MKNFSFERLLALFLVAMMTVSVLPLNAFAHEHDEIVSEDDSMDAIESKPFEETVLLKQIKVDIADLLNKYLGTTTMSEDDVKAAVSAMDEDTQYDAYFAIDDISVACEELTDAEMYFLESYEGMETLGYLFNALDELLEFEDAALFAVGDIFKYFEDKIEFTDTAGTASKPSATAFKATSAASAGTLDFGGKSVTNTITITNNAPVKATLSFTCATSVNNSSNGSASVSCGTGDKSIEIPAESSTSITLTAKASWRKSVTATLNLTNMSVEFEQVESVKYNGILSYDDTLGSVKVAGAAAANGSELSMDSIEGIKLQAIANNGGKFVAWVNAANNEVLSKDANYTHFPKADMDIKAVFSTKAYFTVGKTLYYSLTDAINAAVSGATKTVVLAADGTLPAGTYTIPSGVTLLIPYNADETVKTTSTDASEATTAATAYRTLTMASGAKIVVNGALSVPAVIKTTQGAKVDSGRPVGGYGFIKMEEDSNITVNGGMYVYGFISGNGTVTVNSGANVYETFQISDFRGGNGTTNIQKPVFPMNQYYVQNVEVPMTVYSGATLNSFATVTMSLGTYSTSVPFFAKSGAMFNLSDGYVIKSYDGTTDRLNIEVFGSLKVAPIKMTIGSGLGSTTIDSEKYQLPINSNITVHVYEGDIEVYNQDVAMLPGAKMIVESGANMKLTGGSKVYLYDADEWGPYAGAVNKTFVPVSYAPGKTYTRTDADLVDAEIYVKAGAVMDGSGGFAYTTKSGANIHGEEGAVITLSVGTETSTIQPTYVGSTLGDPHEYTNIPLTPAQLKNADGTYVTAENNTYTYTNGVWVGHVHTEEIIPAKAATCTETGLTEGKKCSDCGEVLVAQQTVAALGHTAGEGATCTTAQTCTVCGTKLNEALGHTEVVDAAKAPTCTETGLTEGKHCSVCGEVLVAQETVDALGHTEVVDKAVAATCTETGLTEGKHCSVCNTVLVDQTVVPKLGHKDEDKNNECDVCEANLCGDNGHIEVTDKAVAPTCTATGLTEGKHCSACGHVIVAQEVVKALGHTEVVDKAKAPTCTETGLTEGKHCSVCGTVTVAQEVVKALGHTEVVDAAKAATCTETGLTEGKHCSVCGTVTVAQETVDALGHKEVVDAAKAPTCTETGLTEGKHCSVCNTVIVAQKEVAAIGHKYTAAVTAPTCTAEGYTTYTCSACGDSYVADKVAALGHKYNAVVTAPTCTAQGYTTYTCSCGDSYVADYVAAKGHTEEDIAAVDPTCQSYGYTAGKKCTVCGTETAKPTQIAKLSHVPGAEATCTEDQVCVLCNTYVFVEALGHYWLHLEAKAPTRTEAGYEAHDVCTECGESTSYNKIPALGEASIDNYDDFIYNLALLEEIANIYVKQYPSKDPVDLVIKYIRTGVERYNSGSWGIMAGYEDADFAKFVADTENTYNAEIFLAGLDEEYLAVTGLKDLKKFKLPNGDMADIGHVFGSMDITYHNKFGLNHADVSGWAGDLVDLLEASAANGVNGSLEEMIEIVGEKYFLSSDNGPLLPTFSKEDYDGDLDAYYIMNVLKSVEYGVGDSEKEYSLTEIFMNYMTEDLTDEYRAAYFMTNRLNTTGTRAQVRNAVYTEYLSNKLISTLEGTRDLTGTKDLINLRRAVCYAFADYVCKLAGDYVESLTNKYYTTFSSTTTELAPGIVQETHMATTADGKQMVYHLATADITRDDVHIFANYNNNDPLAGWAMQRVLDQANAAQNKYGDPNSKYYIPNYKVIAAVNGAGFNMSTGEPGGVLVMGGVEYHAINSSGFFGILKDGTPVIGTTEEYNTIYKGQVQEAIAGFATTLIKDGEICVSDANYTNSRAPRTAVGITKTGKVVFMVFDGRQEPYSCGGSYIEIAQVLRDAGCVEAVNLDGGGSSTFVARQPGASELSVLNSPSDGFQRSVSTSWMIVSTAPSSTEFDHANITSEYAYATIGTPVKMNATGISPAGNETKLPEGYTWAVSDDRFASVSADGVFTGKRNGTVEVYMMLDGEVIGMTTMNVVVPENVYFTRTHMDAVYGANTVLPIAASYNNKPVAFSMSDIIFSTENSKAGTFNGNVFVGNELSGVKVVKVTACLANDASVSGSITLNMFKQGENTFDFNMATGGDREFAWLRDITNSTTFDNITYTVVDIDKDMTTSYVFAIDMTQIPIPSQLADLVYMLPGADLENATAWNFLLQLAERVSVLTEISAVVDFDDDLDVDISNLKVLNEYFSLTSVELDEATNTVTLKLNWIDQTKAIDPTTANPLCMVTGIKLTPKDGADWGANDRLSVINSGTLSYNAFLRANALYSFALKPENQEIYGLKPFVNPNLPSESGASFGSTYKTFEDSYTLVKEVKDGWTVEDGGFAYYQDGEKLTGVMKVDGYYYDFGDNGIAKDQTKYTGVFYDKESGVYRYSEFGELSSGWKLYREEWYYFNPTTMAAQTGKYQFNIDVSYTFDQTGKINSGVWVRYKEGSRYYYGPDYYRSGVSWAKSWFVIDGDRYCFDYKGYILTGIQLIIDRNDQTYADAYDCGVDGKNPIRYTGIIDGRFYSNGGLIKAYQLVEFEGNVYFVSDSHKLAKNTRLYLSERYVSGKHFPDGRAIQVGYYVFDEEGKMIIPEIKNGVIEDKLYINDVLQKAYQLVEYNGDFYFINDGQNRITKNKKLYLSASYVSGKYFPDGRAMQPGNYYFDEEGKMIIPEIKNGVIEDKLYINDVLQKAYQLVEYNGDFYFINDGQNRVAKNQKLYISASYVSGKYFPDGTPLYAGYYTFDADGKMIID